eukprot:657693-Hanusia_phi.AAC.3
MYKVKQKLLGLAAEQPPARVSSGSESLDDSVKLWRTPAYRHPRLRWGRETLQGNVLSQVLPAILTVTVASARARRKQHGNAVQLWTSPTGYQWLAFETKLRHFHRLFAPTFPWRSLSISDRSRCLSESQRHPHVIFSSGGPWTRAHPLQLCLPVCHIAKLLQGSTLSCTYFVLTLRAGGAASGQSA